MSFLPAEALTTSEYGYAQDWILDFGASLHVTPHKEWFSSYADGMKGSVHLGNNYACDIVGVGNIKLSFANGSSFTLQNV